MEKISVKALALSIGIAFGAYILLIGWAAMFGWGTAIVEAISSLYIGYAPTLLGAIIGAVWGFIDGAIAGIIIALIYNYIAGKSK